jgi:CheY-like chemotaxis protein
VLVIEDSPSQALAVEHMLKQQGLDVRCASNGRMGIAMAQQDPPDVIVLDLEMPGMNGFEACRYLKQDPETANIPIVMFTAHADKATTVLEGLDVGAIDFIPKDAFADVVLRETLRQLDVL